MHKKQMQPRANLIPNQPISPTRVSSVTSAKSQGQSEPSSILLNTFHSELCVADVASFADMGTKAPAAKAEDCAACRACRRQGDTHARTHARACTQDCSRADHS